MKKVNAGQPLKIPAADYNRMVDAAKAAQTANIRGGGPTRYAPPETDVVFVKNDSGADRGRFDILGIDSPVIAHADNDVEFESRVAISCVEADPDVHVGRWVVLLDECADGALAPAVISGVCPIQIDVLDADHKYADVNPDSGSREIPASGQFGHEILYKESGTGTKWAVVRLGNPKLTRRFELKTALAIGGTATAYALDWTGSTYSPDKDVEFTVVDSRGLYRGWARRETPLPIRPGAWGEAEFCHDRGAWEIVDLQHVARHITFTTTENMGYSYAGQAAVTVNDYYDGIDPDVVYDDVIVYDPQNIHLYASSGSKGKAVLDDRSDQYHIVEIEPTHYWAKAQSDWEANSDDNRVSCKQCDRDGGNVRGAAVYVYLPRIADCDPTVFEDDVIGFEQADGGVLVCSTVYGDGSKIGDMRFVKAVANIRPGWRECDGAGGAWDMDGRAAVGRDAANGLNIGDGLHATEDAVDHVGGADHPDAEGDTGVADGHSHTIALDYAEVLADAPSRAGVWIERFE